MWKRGVFIAAGIAAFLVFLVAMVPAAQLAGRLPPAIDMAGLGGTIWSGRARSLSIENRPLGAVSWSCRPWRLVMLEWSCHVTLKPPGGELSGNFSGDFKGAVVGQA